MKQSHFYAMLARMKYINRWGLMNNTQYENISEHSQQVAILAGVHIRQYQRIEYGERPMGSINMRFGLAVCAILEINPFDLVSFTADGWEIIPRDDEHILG